MRHFGFLLALLFAYAPALVAQVDRSHQRISTSAASWADALLLEQHPLRSRGIPSELSPTHVQRLAPSAGLAALESRRARLDPLNGAKWGALVGGAAYGGLALLLVASDGDLSGDDAANATVHAIAGALTGALVGLIIGAAAGG